MERFHDELRQENRGIKRGGLKDSDEHIRKRVRSGDKLEIEYIKDDDWEQMSNALKALEGVNNPQEEVEDSEDGDEMYGRGRRYHDIESDEDMDSNYDSEDNDGDEDNEEYDRQSDSEDNDGDEDNEEYDSQSEGDEGESEGRVDKSEMTDEEESSDEESVQTVGGH